MHVLGIETSGFNGSVALARDNTCLEERGLNQVGRRHAQSLVLEISELLRAHSLTPQDVDLVAVSRGPGSFTGLRVGMVCAKTFAYATGCRFLAIDTFAAIAENAPLNVDRLLVLEDAQRDAFFVGKYLRDEFQRWRQVAPIRIVAAEEFQTSIVTDDSLILGPGVKKLDSTRISHRIPDDPVFHQPRASTIAKLASRTLQEVDSTSIDADFWRAGPFYLRMSAAEEKCSKT